jgi:hypothetical protein
MLDSVIVPSCPEMLDESREKGFSLLWRARVFLVRMFCVSILIIIDHQ